MVSKLYDGSNWKNLNGLKLYDGSAWKNTVRGWLWSGSAWKQWYPEYPINTAAPTVSGTATQGNTLSTTNGSWNSNLAYSPASYAYQWRRGSSDISGATSSTYTTVVADVGNAISCRVTATNNRGPTPVISSNSITVTSALPGAPSNLSITSTTTQPGAFSVSTSSSATTTASGSWTSATNTTSYSASTSAGSISANTGARTFTISGGTSGNSYTVTVTAFNTSGSASLSWSAGSNATSYDIYINGVYWTNTANTSISYSWGTTGTLSVNVRSRNATGVETTGVSNSATISTNSRQAQASSTFYAVIPTISGVTNSGKTHNSVTISWSSTNQSSYSITGLGGSWTGSTATSREITGLSGSTSYTATVTVTSSTGQTASGSTNFTTNVTPVIPTVTATVTGISSTGATLSWSSTNQSSYSISTSPNTALNGVSGSNLTSRLFTGLTAATTYNYTVTITSSTGHTAQSSGSFTTTGIAPSAPTISSWVFSSGPSWNGTFTGSSSGSTPITYYWEHWCAINSSGTSATLVASGNTVSNSLGGSFSVGPFNNGGTGFVWGQLRLYAQNSTNSSSTVLSAWA
jgi:hypothetical protein